MFEIQFENKKQDDRLCMGHFSICRHSQSQGLVEKGNHLVEMQIQSMKNEWKESGDVPWSDWLARIQCKLA